MSRRSTPLLSLGVALLGLQLTACSSFFYRAEAIEGWVADAETGTPLEGVISVAHWRLEGGFEGGTPYNEVQILESVSDAQGRFFFPAWGPKFAFFGRLGSESPEILFFKSGHKSINVVNNWYPGKALSKSDWNGKTVKLARFKGTLPEYAQHLSILNGDLWTVGYAVSYHWGDPCGWKSFPRMLKAMDELDKQFKPLRSPHTTVAAQLRANESQLRAAGCGTVTDLIGQ
jgi:hypothetical protein